MLIIWALYIILADLMCKFGLFLLDSQRKYQQKTLLVVFLDAFYAVTCWGFLYTA